VKPDPHIGFEQDLARNLRIECEFSLADADDARGSLLQQ
jgi:hypothetical protein